MKNHGFTLAEVLITLGIIGIVTAITIPTIVNKYQKQQTVAKLKKAYSVLGQVMQRAVADNSAAELGVGETLDANKVKNFFQTYWFPYFNAPSIYSKSLGNDFYSTPSGNSINLGIFNNYELGRVFFITQEGTSYFVSIMTWSGDENGDLGHPLIASKQQVFIDINGLKRPNILGKDVFRFQIDYELGIVRPAGYNRSEAQINKDCSKSGSGGLCAAKIMHDGWQILDDYPW